MVFRSVKGPQIANDKFQRVPRLIPEGYRKAEAPRTSVVVNVCDHIEKV